MSDAQSTEKTRLTDAELDVVLAPCECGHTINDHGALAGCWTCPEVNEECAVSFESMLVERVARIVAERLAAVESVLGVHERGEVHPPLTADRLMRSVRMAMAFENYPPASDPTGGSDD